MQIRNILESVLTAGALVLAQDPSGSVAQTPVQAESEAYVDTVSADVYNAAEFLLCEYAPAQKDYLQYKSLVSATYMAARSAKGLIEGDFGGERNIAEMALLTGELAYWMDVQMRPVRDLDGEVTTHFPPDPDLREEFLEHYHRLLEHIPHLDSLYAQEHPEDTARVNALNPLDFMSRRQLFGPHTTFMMNEDFRNRIGTEYPALPRPPGMTEDEFYHPTDQCFQVIS